MGLECIALLYNVMTVLSMLIMFNCGGPAAWVIIKRLAVHVHVSYACTCYILWSNDVDVYVSLW